MLGIIRSGNFSLSKNQLKSSLRRIPSFKLERILCQTNSEITERLQYGVDNCSKPIFFGVSYFLLVIMVTSNPNRQCPVEHNDMRRAAMQLRSSNILGRSSNCYCRTTRLPRRLAKQPRTSLGTLRLRTPPLRKHYGCPPFPLLEAESLKLSFWRWISNGTSCGFTSFHWNDSPQQILPEEFFNQLAIPAIILWTNRNEGFVKRCSLFSSLLKKLQCVLNRAKLCGNPKDETNHRSTSCMFNENFY